MEDCLFCKIAAGDIPSKKLYEDEQVVAFYDIAPQAKVHFLVIPKKHIPSAAALTEEDGALLGHVFAVIAKLAREQGLDNGYRVISNVGEDAGQTVTVAGDLPYRQVGIGNLGTCRDGSSTSVDGLHRIRIHVIGQTAGAADT